MEIKNIVVKKNEKLNTKLLYELLKNKHDRYTVGRPNHGLPVKVIRHDLFEVEKSGAIIYENQLWSDYMFCNQVFSSDYFFNGHIKNCVFLKGKNTDSDFRDVIFENCIFIDVLFAKSWGLNFTFKNCIFYGCTFNGWELDPRNLLTLLFMHCQVGGMYIREDSIVRNIQYYMCASKASFSKREMEDYPYDEFYNKEELENSKIYQHFNKSLDYFLKIDYDSEEFFMTELEDNYELINDYKESMNELYRYDKISRKWYNY